MHTNACALACAICEHTNNSIEMKLNKHTNQQLDRHGLPQTSSMAEVLTLRNAVTL